MSRSTVRRGLIAGFPTECDDARSAGYDALRSAGLPTRLLGGRQRSHRRCR